MPILNAKLCAAPSQETSAKVAAVLTDLTVDILKKKRELTAVVIEYTSPADWFIAGAPLASQTHRTFYLDQGDRRNQYKRRKGCLRQSSFLCYRSHNWTTCSC